MKDARPPSNLEQTGSCGLSDLLIGVREERFDGSRIHGVPDDEQDRQRAIDHACVLVGKLRDRALTEQFPSVLVGVSDLLRPLPQQVLAEVNVS